MDTSFTRRAATAAVFAVAGILLSLALGRHTGHRPAPTPDVLPPAGWTEVCEPAAIGDVCRTYPPGDRRWEPTAPMPPWAPLGLPVDQDGSIIPPSPSP